VQSILYVMAIMGCGESDAPCRELRVDRQTYASESRCQAGTEAALMRHTDLEFPTIVARCRRANARPQLLRGSEVLLPAPNSSRVLPRLAARSSR